MTSFSVDEIRKRVTREDWSEIYSGAHVVVENDTQGVYYKRWRQAAGPNAKHRWSSHYVGLSRVQSVWEQYEIGNLLVEGEPGVLLVGRTPSGATFFQFERHSGVVDRTQIQEAVKHMQSWLTSSASKKQLGPGQRTSTRTDAPDKRLNVTWPLTP